MATDVSYPILVGYNIRIEPGGCGVVNACAIHHNSRSADVRVFEQDGADFVELDTKPTNLHLIVKTA
ncbi:hypothetical protein [Mycetohabitans rhizoxinica]|uniref:hypothetical protein n=1 Tax=Mycetohabitans rhizoxinica TaxID=412963 RepID=UPI001E481689|nr:hypothetical protein [Mycetohabitans rhizoxinica]